MLFGVVGTNETRRGDRRRETWSETSASVFRRNYESIPVFPGFSTGTESTRHPAVNASLRPPEGEPQKTTTSPARKDQPNVGSTTGSACSRRQRPLKDALLRSSLLLSLSLSLSLSTKTLANDVTSFDTYRGAATAGSC